MFETFKGPKDQKVWVELPPSVPEWHTPDTATHTVENCCILNTYSHHLDVQAFDSTDKSEHFHSSSGRI